MEVRAVDRESQSDTGGRQPGRKPDWGWGGRHGASRDDNLRRGPGRIFCCRGRERAEQSQRWVTGRTGVGRQATTLSQACGAHGSDSGGKRKLVSLKAEGKETVRRKQ